MFILKQATAVDVSIGPFVDSGDGWTPESGLSPAVKLSKNGEALGAKSDVTTPVYDADGFYNCELDATDTGTVGTLRLSVVGSATSLPVFHDYQVVEEAIYDAYYAASAAGIEAVAMGALSQGKPPATPTMIEALMHLYWQEVYAKVIVDTNTANQKQDFADDGSTILYEADIADASSIFTKSEVQSGV